MKKILLLLAIGYSAFTFSQGIVSSYPFSGNANDMTGTNHAIVNGAILTADRFGTPNAAYFFDGNSSIDFPVSFDFVSRTISVWAKPMDKAFAPGSIYISDNPNLNYGSTNIQADFYNSNYQIGMTLGNANAFYSCDTGEWYNIVLVRSASVAKFFVNGIQVSLTSNPSNYASANGAAFARLGSSRNNIEKFYGVIDDVKIYDTALSDNEVLQLTSVETREAERNLSMTFNSATNTYSLQMPYEGSSTNREVSLYNASGQLIKKFSANNNTIDITPSVVNYIAGVYILTSGSRTAKLVF